MMLLVCLCFEVQILSETLGYESPSTWKELINITKIEDHRNWLSVEEINEPVSLKPCVHVKLMKFWMINHLDWKELLNITLRLRTTKTDINEAQLVWGE